MYSIHDSENKIEINQQNNFGYFQKKKIINDLPNKISWNNNHRKDMVDLFAKYFSNVQKVYTD